MSSLNKVILIGHLGADPDVRRTTAGDPVTTIRVATSENWKDKTTGEKKEHIEWHRVIFYGRLAEIVGEYLKKGRQIYVEGRIQTRKWQDQQTGADRYMTEIIANEMKMLGSSRSEASAPESASRSTVENRVPATATYGEDLGDDIPF